MPSKIGTCLIPFASNGLGFVSTVLSTRAKGLDYQLILFCSLEHFVALAS